VTFAERAGMLLDFDFAKAIQQNSSSNQEVWQMLLPKRLDPVSAESDAALYAQGWVVVVPMVADELDTKLLSDLKSKPAQWPSWLPKK